MFVSCMLYHVSYMLCCVLYHACSAASWCTAHVLPAMHCCVCTAHYCTAGKTVEVNNTDAEGRLTLADALWFAQVGCCG